MNKLTAATLAGAGAALFALGWLCFDGGRGGLHAVVDQVRDMPVMDQFRTIGGNYQGPPCVDEKEVGPGQPKPYCGDLPSLAAVNVREAKLEMVSDAFSKPWAFEFIDDTELLVTEFSGSLKRLDLDTGQAVGISGLPEIVPGDGQAGLLDIALHPQFARNGLIYFSYVITDGDERYTLAVARARLVGDTLHNVQRIFTGLPWGKSKSNFGGALLFDEAGYLFITVGDRTIRGDAQHPGLLTGKVVRLHDDGSVPDDNPYSDRPDTYDPAIYALGVRNPQGLALDPESGYIYETEHGPMGGDEVNRLEAGVNYGWPVITYGRNYTYKPIGEGTVKKGLQQPLYYYLPSLAISPIAVYRGEMFPEWNGDLLVGTLKGAGVSKLDLLDGAIRSDYLILSELGAKVRDIKVAPDSSIWVLVQSGGLYRLSREANPLQEKLGVGQRDGETVYLLVCSGCHDHNVPGVPQLANGEDWTQRLQKEPQTWYMNTLRGYNEMPEKGLCEDCTGEELKRAVIYMRNRVIN